MKKLIKYLAASVAVSALFAACTKQTPANPYEGEALPAVSIAGDSQFVLDKANVTLTLDHMIHKDVTVVFDVQGIEREALNLPETGVVQAGSVKKVIPIAVDEDKASIGNKNVVITIKEADNATVATGSTTIGINVEDIALVDVSATDFDENLEATLTFTLSKKVTKDVVLGIAYDSKDGSERMAFPAGKLSFDNTVTIPAGEKVGTLKVQANKTGVEEGAYQAHFTVGSYGANAKAGSTPDATLILNVGFQPTLVSTDDIYFQYSSGWWYVNYDKLHEYYFIWSEPESYGNPSDMDYVKAAMKRCREWILDDKHRKDWLDYWAAYIPSGYTNYIWHSCPQLTSEKIGYVGWPMIMINDGAIEDLDEVTYGNGVYHSFLIGFTADMELVETYQYYKLTK